MVYHRWPMKFSHAPAIAAGLMIAACIVIAAPAAFAQADAGTDIEKSQALAAEGAGHFKNKEYLAAAQLFEQAYRLNPTDAIYLRYAGRGWQEVGHWERAKQILERYYAVEQDPNRKATILKHLSRLRRATPLVIAERLRFATQSYPGRGLELDAGFAFEKLGELECKQGNGDAGVKALNQAKQFFEVARLSTNTPGERMEISTAVKRAEGKIDKCKPFCAEKLDGPWCADATTLIVCIHRRAKTTTICKTKCTSGGPGQPGKCLAAVIKTGPTGPKKPPPPPPSGGVVKYIVGGLLLVGGGGLAGFGFVQSTTANDEYKRDGKRPQDEWIYPDYDAYKAAKATASYMFLGGAATAVVGAGVLAWGIASGGSSAPAAKTTWLLPQVGPRGFSLSFAGTF